MSCFFRVLYFAVFFCKLNSSSASIRAKRRKQKKKNKVAAPQRPHPYGCCGCYCRRDRLTDSLLQSESRHAVANLFRPLPTSFPSALPALWRPPLPRHEPKNSPSIFYFSPSYKQDATFCAFEKSDLLHLRCFPSHLLYFAPVCLSDCLPLSRPVCLAQSLQCSLQFIFCADCLDSLPELPPCQPEVH